MEPLITAASATCSRVYWLDWVRQRCLKISLKWGDGEKPVNSDFSGWYFAVSLFPVAALSGQTGNSM